MYHPRSKEEDAKCNNLWSWAHTDYGSLTLLFSQTVSGLQVKMPSGEYRDIKPQKGSIVVNVADTLSFMTKGDIDFHQPANDRLSQEHHTPRDPSTPRPGPHSPCGSHLRLPTHRQLSGCGGAITSA